MRRNTLRTVVRVSCSLLVLSLVGLGACKGLQKAAQDGEITGSELAAAASSSGEESQTGPSNQQSNSTAQSGASAQGSHAEIKDRAKNAPRQKSWKDLTEKIELTGGETTVSMDETAKSAKNGEERCRWLEYTIYREHEGGGNYTAPEPYHNPRGLKGSNDAGTAECSEAESAPTVRSVVRHFSDNDNLIAGKWVSNWDVIRDDGDPIQKERTARIYTKESKTVAKQLPTPTKEELREMVARAIPDNAYDNIDKGSSVFIERVEAVQVGTDFEYRTFDAFDADDPQMFVPVETFRMTETTIRRKERIRGGNRVTIEGVDDYTERNCDGVMWFYFRAADEDEKDGAYDLQGTKVIPRVAMMEGPHGEDTRTWAWQTIRLSCAENNVIQNAF